MTAWAVVLASQKRLVVLRAQASTGDVEGVEFRDPASFSYSKNAKVTLQLHHSSLYSAPLLHY